MRLIVVVDWLQYGFPIGERNNRRRFMAQVTEEDEGEHYVLRRERYNQ